ncbi:MAG: hypothetical protein ACK4UN_15535 [Limisphaerales bacterium]
MSRRAKASQVATNPVDTFSNFCLEIGGRKKAFERLEKVASAEERARLAIVALIHLSYGKNGVETVDTIDRVLDAHAVLSATPDSPKKDQE